jgi:protein ImuB
MRTENSVFLALWLQHWPTDRIRKHDPALPAETPLVTAWHDGRRRIVAAADAQALALGLRAGLPLAQAQARVAGLAIVAADPAGDAAALADLAAWCLRYTPLAAPAPPDGVLLDITGCAHLFGGAAALRADLLGRLERAGFSARAAAAATPGAAQALARHDAACFEDLPVAALRLSEAALALLQRLGLARIGDLARLPRGPLTRRLGSEVLLRLDQVFGRVAEPIQPVVPPEAVRARLAFAEPIATAEAIAAAIDRLAPLVCAGLAAAGRGARRLALVCERLDGIAPVLRAGTAAPVRDAAHLARLLRERIPTLDPGLGIEAMTLIVAQADALAATQPAHGLLRDDAAPPDLNLLVDRLSNRLGAAKLYRMGPRPTDIPERSVARLPPLAPADPQRGWGRGWDRPRPARLLPRPQPIEAVALLPDHPPAQFTWRRVRHRVRRADGPERIHGEWWRRDSEFWALRDYFRVEDEAGRRFWLFRRGNGHDPATGDGAWFVHGIE